QAVEDRDPVLGRGRHRRRILRNAPADRTRDPIRAGATTFPSRRSSSMQRSLFSALVLVLGLTAVGRPEPSPAPGGTLDVVGPDGAPLGSCPLEHTDVVADVAGFVAHVTVTQVFRNPSPDPIEAVYTFPLSERGAVNAMTLTTGDRVIRADIERRDDARRRYEAARDAGQVASLLDQERPNVFTQSVAN